MTESVHDNISAPPEVPSRRKFLRSVGAGMGAAAAVGVGISEAGAQPLRRSRPQRLGLDTRAPVAPPVSAGPDRFGRLFNNLPSFAQHDRGARDQGLLEALTEIGRPGGILDAKDPLEVGPVRLITEPELSPNNRDNPTHTAGLTFVGQFLDHDITRDAGSPLGQRTSVRRSTNLRSARFDLDTVYGGGPEESPQLYEPGTPGRFRVESGGLFEDLPRDEQGLAIIGDPRNDENMIISGLQVAMLKFHNAVLDQVLATGLTDIAAFEEARRLVRWHWQWLIVHQFLPAFVGQPLVNELRTVGRRYYQPQSAQIPVEFQTSAYRFGHSMIRPSYRANLAGDNGEAFFGFIFDPAEFGKPDPGDLMGGSRAPRRFIGWQTFFDFGDGEVKPNKRIDAQISTPMFQLPIFAIDSVRGGDVGPTSLATRNLHRHVTWSIPSGQSIANAMGAPQLAPADLAKFAGFHPSLDTSTPLWMYILHEADVVNDGLFLGPVGGRIVGEVFMSLLELDDTSWVRSQPDWTPTLDSVAGPGEFRMVDLLRIAGVDPETRGQ